MKHVVIDFLYLDRNTCERCKATNITLNEALDILSPLLQTLGYSVTVNEINITTEALAMQYRFESSPTIKVNGIDICKELVENNCESCGDLCGDSIDCRVFRYEGKEYDQPPTAAIIDGILRVLYQQTQDTEQIYEVPENLKKYFKGRKSMMKKMSIYEPAMCCETGICGVGVDPELLRISTVLNTLKENGIEVKRANLNSAPGEFVSNQIINDFLNTEGVEKLPAVMIDDEIVMTGRYPTNTEFVEIFSLPEGILNTAEAKQEDCCCCGEEGCC